MQKNICFGVISVWLLAFTILIFGVHFDGARAQATPKKDRDARALACGKEFIDRCNNMPVGGNDLLACMDERVKKLPPGCTELAKNFVRMCDADAARLCKGVVEGKGNVIACLIKAKDSVSAQCNAAIDAASLRH